MPDWTRETIIAEARKVAATVGGSVSKSAFKQQTGISDYYVGNTTGKECPIEVIELRSVIYGLEA